MSAFDNDPWATGPADDPWAAGAAYADSPRDEAQTTPNTTTAKETPNMSEGKIVTTIKFGAGYDAPWAVFHSNDLADAEATLNEAKSYLELVARVAKYSKTLDSGTAAKAAEKGGAQRQSTPPGTPSKNCAHGEMTYRTGNGVKGSWQGYFCPLPKGDDNQCKAIFVNNR